MYVIKTVGLVFVILVVMYIFLFRRSRSIRKDTSQINSVQDYHDSYLSHRHTRQSRYDYITKYNSDEDYRPKI